MALMNFVVSALLLSSALADPDVLQGLYDAPSNTNSPSGSSGSNVVRSGLIPVPGASRFESSFSGSSSGSVSTVNQDSSGFDSFSGLTILNAGSSTSSASLPGSILVNEDASSESSTSGNFRRNSGGSGFSGPLSGVTLSSSKNVDSGLLIDADFALTESDEVTITHETTEDVFKTVTNVIYNSIPITLTEFMKTTAVQPTFQVLSTAVDDHVFVATAPVTRTDSVTVTNTNTGYLYYTEVSTDLYTITHKAYNILQKTLTSTLQQTKVFRPTIVRTHINTEYDTQTVDYLVTNTVVVKPHSTLTFTANPQTQIFQQFIGHRPQGFFNNQQGHSSAENAHRYF